MYVWTLEFLTNPMLLLFADGFSQDRFSPRSAETWERTGNDACCSNGIAGFCGEGDGDCDDDSECAGSLVCGQDNCPWADGDDCCKQPGMHSVQFSSIKYSRRAIFDVKAISSYKSLDGNSAVGEGQGK